MRVAFLVVNYHEAQRGGERLLMANPMTNKQRNRCNNGQHLYNKTICKKIHSKMTVSQEVDNVNSPILEMRKARHRKSDENGLEPGVQIYKRILKQEAEMLQLPCSENISFWKRSWQTINVSMLLTRASQRGG